MTGSRCRHPLFLALILSSFSHNALSFVPSSAGIVVRGAMDSSSALDASAAPASDDCMMFVSAKTPSTPQKAEQRHTRRRREIVASLFSIESSSLAATIMVGAALLPNQPAYASLLDDYGADPIMNKQPEKTTTSTKKVKELARDKGKIESSMEPNLRSNYYYPTNKVRYLPRIKKCSDAIPSAALAIGNEDWDAVRNFATVIADDTVLPMKLYVSSLSGGGTNVKVGFAKDMMTSAKAFEKQQSLLVKSVDKKDAAKATAALEGMAEALLSYRTVGKLLGPDGGGDIPSVDEIRRSTKRFRGEAFEAKVKERDARVKAAAQASAVVHNED